MINLVNKPQQILNLLGLANKARKTAAGEQEVLRMMPHAKLLFVAADASERTRDRFEKKCYFYGTVLVTGFSGEQLAKATGKPLCKIIAVTDQGFSEAIKTYLEVH